MTDELAKDELVRQATAFYDSELRTRMEAGHRDEFVAVEPVSRTYYLGKTMVEATRQSRAAFPGRRSYVMRVGHPSALLMVGMTITRRPTEDTEESQLGS